MGQGQHVAAAAEADDGAGLLRHDRCCAKPNQAGESRQTGRSTPSAIEWYRHVLDLPHSATMRTIILRRNK